MSLGDILPRKQWLHFDMTEKLLTLKIELNKTYELGNGTQAVSLTETRVFFFLFGHFYVPFKISSAHMRWTSLWVG